MEGLVCGNYRLTRKLGQVGMAEVWAAQHFQLTRQAAIKLLQLQMLKYPNVVKRFLSAARAVSAIDHPGLVKIYDVGYASDGRAFIAMERLHGEGLADRLHRLGTLSLRETYRFMRQLAMTMEAVHSLDIVHRALQPDSLFIVPDIGLEGGERIKVLDFGLAELTCEYSGAGDSDGVVPPGPTTYIAPEQRNGAGVGDERADLYSMGCIFYRCICGCPPYEHAHPSHAASTGGNSQPKRPSEQRSDLHPVLDDIIMSLLARSPDDRPTTCGEFIIRLSTVPAPALEEGQVYPQTHQSLTAHPLAMSRRGSTSPTRTGRGTTSVVRVPASERLHRHSEQPQQSRVDREDVEPSASTARRKSRYIIREAHLFAGKARGVELVETSDRRATQPAGRGAREFVSRLSPGSTRSHPRRLLHWLALGTVLTILGALGGLVLILRDRDPSNTDRRDVSRGLPPEKRLTIAQVDELLLRGYAALAKGEYEAAARLCRQILDDWDPNHVEANVLCAKSACVIAEPGSLDHADFMKHIPPYRRDVFSYCHQLSNTRSNQ